MFRCNEIVPNVLPSVTLDTRTMLPKQPGIYFVIEDEQILYIGRSENIYLRWLQHHKYLELKENNSGSRIAWLICSEIFLLNDIERALIHKFKPILNKVIPSISKINKNIIDLEIDDSFVEVIKTESENRPTPVTIRLNQDDKEWLYQTVKDLNIPLNAFIKSLLDQYRYGYKQTQIKGDN